MNAFVDTSAFFALLSKQDSNHQIAADEWRNLASDESVLLCTSNYVIVETCALVRRRLGDLAVRRFLDSLLPLVMVIWVDQRTHEIAVEAMLVRGKNGPSLVDCASFAIMRELSMEKALAYDAHFAAEGFGV